MKFKSKRNKFKLNRHPNTWWRQSFFWKNIAVKNGDLCAWYEICCVKAGGPHAEARGKLINHGDTEITERATSKGLTRRRGDRGGGRLTESRPLGKVEIDQPKVSPQGAASGTMQVNLQDFDSRSSRAFASRKGGGKKSCLTWECIRHTMDA